MIKLDDKHYIKQDGYSFILCETIYSEEVDDTVKERLKKQGKEVKEQRETTIGYYATLKQAINGYLRKQELKSVGHDELISLKDYLISVTDVLKRISDCTEF